MGHFVLGTLSPSNYGIPSLILPGIGRRENAQSSKTILYVSSGDTLGETFLMVRSWHTVVLSRAPKVIPCLGDFIHNLQCLCQCGDDFLPDWEALIPSGLFNVCHMPGMCSVQETKENASALRKFRCKAGDCHTSQQF